MSTTNGIEDLEQYIRGIWDWKFLNDYCFPGTKIRVTDVDGMVERRGHTIMLEGSRPGKPENKGQHILAERLANEKCPHCGRSTGLHTQVIFAGDPLTGDIERMEVVGSGPPRPASKDDLRDMVAAWFRRVNTPTSGA